jgi:predicted metal-dependent phosphoesterase TrpH
MGYADLHIHSIYSYDGTARIPEILEFAARRTDLSVIAITDHDEIDGAWEATMLSHRYGIEVVPGLEVTARDGHILALFTEERIPRGLSALETVLAIRAAGGLAVAAHPLARGVHGLSGESIRRILAHPDAAQTLVALESVNAGLPLRGSNGRTADLARSLPVGCTGGSDSHVAWTIGQGVTVFPGQTAADLRAALEARVTTALYREQPSMTRLIATWIPGRVARRVTWAPTHP